MKKEKINQTKEAQSRKSDGVSPSELSELLPCPFCGSKATIKKSWPFGEYYPTCTKEGRCPGIVEEQDEQGGTCCDCKTIEEAIKLWNTRAR